MLNILVFDYNSSIKDGTWNMYSLIFKTEITLNFLSILYYIMNISIDYRTRDTMTNTRRIHHFIYFTCPINNIAFIVQKVLILFNTTAGYDPSTKTFQLIQFIRLVTCLATFICLPAFVIERSFATYFLHDYEKKPRRWIGYTMGIMVYTISLTSVFLSLYFGESFLPFIVLLVVNIISCLGNIIIYRMNYHYYNICLRKFAQYSLAERYQISENIQFAKSFNIFALILAFFATLCSSLLLVSSLKSIHSDDRNMLITVFDTVFSIYVIYAPYTHYKYNVTWQHEFKKCTKRYSTTVNMECSYNTMVSLQLKNTFGKKMNIGVTNQSDTYFQQLTNSWNTPNNNQNNK